VRLRPLVLCYHAVSDSWPHLLAIGPAVFERQLHLLLARGFRPASAAATVNGSRRLLHVTFDDAFTSVQRAVPILERLRVRATVFACSGLADEGLRLEVPELAEHAARYPGELVTMGWDALRDVAERGIEIGSHAISHPHLPRLGDDELARELRESRERIEDELRRPCPFLAYPFGDQDARVRLAARAAGYTGAFALPGNPVSDDPFAIPRVGLWRKDGTLRALLKTSHLGRLAGGAPPDS
jgi:peptidoglycan/xylan/chitin deacetylase (PgdA/CDA1 family)